MSKDLKTLEDLEEGDGKDIVRTVAGNAQAVSVPNISSHDLRTEAKKWIKDWERYLEEIDNTSQRQETIVIDSKIQAFKEFFNIEEVDIDGSK